MEFPLLDAQELVIRLRKGSPVFFPTDTVPALAALPEFAAQLWELKNRSNEKPLILMGGCAEDLLEFVLPEALDDASEIAKDYWPGPLTMVLPTFRGKIVEKLNPFGKTLGFRVPNCEQAKAFLAKSGPLATTSANLSGENPLILPEDLSNSFPGLPLLGPVPWPRGSCLASTVIAWEGKGNWLLLRKGAVIPINLKK